LGQRIQLQRDRARQQGAGLAVEGEDDRRHEQAKRRSLALRFHSRFRSLQHATPTAPVETDHPSRSGARHQCRQEEQALQH